MLSFNPIQLAYGVMIVGMVLCFVLSRNFKKDMRKESDKFALPFAKLSNYICPNTLPVGLSVEELGGGKVRVLPLEEQSEQLRFVIKRANANKSVKLFAEMVSAADEVTKMAGINRTRKSQFSDPINEILHMTHTFLVGCENLGTIDTVEKKEQFDSFIQRQVEHRMVLLRRISGATAEEYRKLNRNYAEEMEAIEKQQEIEKRHGGNRKPEEPAQPSRAGRQEDRYG